MHFGFPSWLAPFLLTAAAGAQGQVGLSFVSPPRASTAFSDANLGNGVHDVHQISMIPHPNGTPGLYLGGMSIEGLPLNLGGRGTIDVVAFTYDRNTDTVSLNANAVIFNASGEDFSLGWGLDGSYAVAERVHGRSAGVYQAMAQSGPGSTVGPLVLIGGVIPGTQPMPGRIGGKNVLFFTSLTNGIVWCEHDVLNATLVGPTFQATANTAQYLVHSPYPMTGADGDAEGLLACQVNIAQPSESVWTWQGDLDPATAPIPQSVPPLTFENNGCEAGGRVYMPRVTGVNTRAIWEYDVVGLLGDSVKATGGTLDLTAFSPTKATGAQDLTIFVMGSQFLGTPLPVAGISNALGLDPAAGTLVLGLVLHSNATGRGILTMPTPPLGVGTIPVQGVTLLRSQTPTHFTSTAVVKIVP